jgi:methyl-accepting chemotaxis protein
MKTVKKHLMEKGFGPRMWIVNILMGCFILCAYPSGNAQAQELSDFDLQVKTWALECKEWVIKEVEKLLQSGELTEARLFDTFYIPIPNTNPQKYHTQYDLLMDKVLQSGLDSYLEKDHRLIFVVLVDKNGYLPTHNSRYSKPLTGNSEEDIINNRTKRLFNDRTGLAASRNTQPYLLQRYFRDTGEEMYDLSVPVFIREKHWGAVRFGYTYK